ncbi:MAG TPA: hypothetical protein VM778_09895 [Gemmatimonadota bacterium]|nr:hypothetical protein [Gemmatimonadota bacterium]
MIVPGRAIGHAFAVRPAAGQLGGVTSVAAKSFLKPGDRATVDDPGSAVRFQPA